MSTDHFQLGRGHFEEIQLIDREYNNEAPRRNLDVGIIFVSRLFQLIGCRMDSDPIMSYLLV